MGMKLVSVKMPRAYIEGIDYLVKVKKVYPSRSEAVRIAIRDLLMRELPHLFGFNGGKRDRVSENKITIERLVEKLEGA